MAPVLRDLVYELSFIFLRLYLELIYLVPILFYRLPVAIINSILYGFKQEDRVFKSVLITGASVGLGAGLAERFSKPGTIITVTARSNVAVFDELKERCESRGATFYAVQVDVRNEKHMREVIAEAHARRRLDLVIANAGITPNENGITEAGTVIDVNCRGTVNTIMPALELILDEENDKSYQPQLVLMSSLGGVVPAASFFMVPYTASKHCIRLLGEGLRVALKGRVGVTVIMPGMTETRMTKTQMAQGINMVTGVWPLEKAVDIMEDGIKRNAGEVAWPLVPYVFARWIGSTIGWVKDLVAPISTTIGDPYIKYDKVIWESANIFKPIKPNTKRKGHRRKKSKSF